MNFLISTKHFIATVTEVFAICARNNVPWQLPPYF
jgi:hypothetical protein